MRPAMPAAHDAYSSYLNPSLVPALACMHGRFLTRLPEFTTVIVADDSGSMCNIADPDVGGMTRWEELKQTISICIDAHSAVGIACDVYFIK